MTFQELVDAATTNSAIQLQDETLHYPVIVDKAITVRGPANIKLGNSGGSVFIGVQRAINSVPNPLDNSKVAYRTNNTSRLWLPASPWQIQPPVSVKMGFVINSLPTGQVALFGSIESSQVGPHLPAPYFCIMDPLSISVFSSTGKSFYHYTWQVGYHELLVQIDTTTTMLVVDGVPLIPFRVLPCATPNPVRTVSFGVGGLADGMTSWSDFAGGSHDFTYCGLIVVSGIVNPTSFWQNYPSPTQFCRLMNDDGKLVHCYGNVGNGTLHTYGAMMLVGQETIPTPSFENVQFNCPFWMGGCSDVKFWKTTFGHGLTSPGGWPTWPVSLDGCTVQGTLRGAGNITWIARSNIDFMSFQQCNVSMTDIFMRGQVGRAIPLNYVECLGSTYLQARNVMIDPEGKNTGPKCAYFYAEKYPLGDPQLLSIENCTVGSPAVQADVLVQAGIPQTITNLSAFGRTPTVATFGASSMMSRIRRFLKNSA